MVGIVAKNYDKDMPGRVCVTIPTRDKDANELQWVARPTGGPECLFPAGSGRSGPARVWINIENRISLAASQGQQQVPLKIGG